MLRRALLLGGLLLALGLWSLCMPSSARVGALFGVPRMESSAAQLEYALERRSALRGATGAVRERERSTAIEALRAVGQYWPDDGQRLAEASFRAAELLRAAGSLEEAELEFGRARSAGSSPFRARAQLERGHVRRRLERWEPALSDYEAVVHDAAAVRGLRDEAELWAGRAWMELGHPESALRAWRRVCSGAEDPVDRVRAWDRIASWRVETGALESAAAELQRCREALADVALEETELGARVRSALEHMRALSALRKRVAEREAARSGRTNGTTKDLTPNTVP